MSEFLRITCPECDKKLKVRAPEDEDDLITCPHCDAEFSPEMPAAPRRGRKPGRDEEDEDEDQPSSGSKDVLLIGGIVGGAMVLGGIIIVISLLSRGKPTQTAQAPTSSGDPAPLMALPPTSPVATNPTPMPETPTGPLPVPNPAQLPPGTAVPLVPGTVPPAVGIPLVPGTVPPATGVPLVPGTVPPAIGVPLVPGTVPAPPANPLVPGTGFPKGPGVDLPGPGKEPARPALDLNQGKTRLAGIWETQIVDPRTRQASVVSLQFGPDGSYNNAYPKGNAKIEEKGTWQMSVEGDAYLVSINAAVSKDGKAIGQRSNSSLVSFDGNDQMMVRTEQAATFFVRKK